MWIRFLAEKVKYKRKRGPITAFRNINMCSLSKTNIGVGDWRFKRNVLSLGGIYFTQKLLNSFESSCIIFHFYNLANWVPVSLQSWQHCIVSVFSLKKAPSPLHFIRYVKWYLIVTLSCHLMANKVKTFFMCLLSVYLLW